MPAAEFRAAGHALVDLVADRLARIADGPVTPNDSPAELRALLGADRGLPVEGAPADQLVMDAARLLFDHSLFNGHPRFFGYITSSPSPIGMLGDFLASALNQNVGAWNLSPLATEIGAADRPLDRRADRVAAGRRGPARERRQRRELHLLSRGARGEGRVGRAHGRAAARGSLRRLRRPPKRTPGCRRPPTCSAWAPTPSAGSPSTPVSAWTSRRCGARSTPTCALGHRPFLVVGTAGTVSTGVVDPLADIAAVCRAPRHVVPRGRRLRRGRGARAGRARRACARSREADSVAVDPHKWLYAPLEAGCVLVRDPEALRKPSRTTPATTTSTDR